MATKKKASAVTERSVSRNISENSVWTIPLGVTELKIHGISADIFDSGSDQDKVTGTATLFDTVLVVEASPADRTVRTTASNVALLKIIEELLGDVDLPEELPQVTFDQVELTISPQTGSFTLSAGSSADWEIPLGVTGLSIEDVQFTATRQKTGADAFETSGTIGGTVLLGGAEFQLSCDFPGDLVFTAGLPAISLSAIIQDLCGSGALMGLPAPNSIMQLSLTDIQITAAPRQKLFSVSGNSPLGRSEVVISKNAQGSWAFTAAFAPPESWRFSTIDSSLQPLDNLRLGNSMLVLSSSDSRDIPVTIVEIPENSPVIRGLTFLGMLNLDGMGVDDLMSVEQLMVSAAIGPNPAQLKLAARMGGSFRITDNISMGDMSFFLRPAPSNFELGVSGSVLAKIDNNPLTFVGTMGIRPIERSAAFAATMLGAWNEPFGVKGLSMSNVAMEVGVGIVPPPAVAAPIVGLAGTIGIGSFSGNAAVKFDTANPGKSMIAAGFNRLQLEEVLRTFCDPAVYAQIPAGLRQTVLKAGMEDVNVYVVPQPTTIGELFYEPGFKFQGKMSIADFDAEFFFLLDYNQGIAIKASMDPINIENIFVLSGSGDQPRPTIDVDLRMGGKPGVEIAGTVNLLGISRETRISISDDGFSFFMEGKLFHLFSAGLTVRGGNLKSGGDFYIKAELQNDLISYLRENTTRAIGELADAAIRDLEKAQQDVDKAQAEIDKIANNIASTRRTIQAERERDAQNVRNAENAVNGAQQKVTSLQSQIDAMRRTIQSERDRDTQRVRDAENAVSAAQGKVDALQRDIDNMRRIIQAERDRDTQRLRDAQNAVASAQSKVNGIQGEINSTKSRIRQLEDDISRKKTWYDNLPWYKKTYGWIEYSGYAAAKGAEIAALYTKIGGMEAAKVTALGVLEAAKQVVRGIEAAAKTFPIDADPRIAGLFTAKGSATVVLEGAKQTLRALQTVIKTFPIDADPRILGLVSAKETANLALEAAKQTLKGLQAVIKNFPIDADPRIVALFTAQGAATASLQAAKLFLEGLKASVGGLAKAGQFIAEFGLGGLLDVRAARFEGQLNAVKGGAVNMELQLILMKNPLDIAIGFNFNNPLASVKMLADRLIAQIG